MPTDAARLTRLTTLAVAVALVARLAFAFGYWTGKPLTNDELEYLQLGRNLAAGEGFTYGPTASGQAEPLGFGRAPLYPLLVSTVARVTASGALIPAMKVTQCVLGATAVWLLALVTRRAAGARAGALAAWIAALYPPLAWLPAFMLSESLYVVLAFVNVLILGRVIDGDALTDRPDRKGALRWIAAAGIAAGLAALTRPSHVFFLAVACLWLLAKRRLSWAAALAIAAALTIGPWTIRNYLTYGRPVLIASEGGITFWTGNHPLSPGEGDMAANPAIKLDSLRVRDGHPGLTAEELEPIYYREALGAIAARPGWWLGLEARKFFYLWIPVGPSYLLHSRLFLYATWLSYGLLMPVGLLGLWRLSAGPGVPRALLLLLGSTVLACLVFLPQERFRIPVIDPALIVGAAAVVGTRHRSNSVF